MPYKRNPGSNRWLARVGCALVLVAMAAGCVTTPGRSAATAFVVVRHAEKAADDPRDPTLSETGNARATALALLLRHERVIAAYATPYRRTQLTAAPAARASGIEVATYDPQLPAAAFARLLRDTHGPGTVLVVGHSNTVPEIAAALCACTVPAMGDHSFNVIHRIEIRPGAAPVLHSSIY